MIAGVDGYAGKWLVVSEDDDAAVQIDVASSIEDILERRDLSHVVIDVPIGLPESGSRECDILARKELGERRSSVFPSPVRGVLGAKTYADACERWVKIDGRKASKQLFAILLLIRSVDSSMSPERQDRVREGHPELSFARMNEGPLEHSKKSPLGMMKRLELLSPHFPDVADSLWKSEVPAASNDAIDAYALLWTARRWRDGIVDVIPEDPKPDGRGLRMEMIC